AHWCLGAGIVATVCANLAHGLGHGPIGALISAWPALALAGSFELLMLLVRAAHESASDAPSDTSESQEVSQLPRGPNALPTLNETVRAWHEAGQSQRAIARELNIDRRKIKQIIERAA